MLPKFTPPQQMTRCRKLLGTSHSGRYAYYLDNRDRYVYQFDCFNFKWIGWICAHSAWPAFEGSMDDA